MVRQKEKFSGSRFEVGCERTRKSFKEGHHFFGPNADYVIDEFIELHIDNSSNIWTILRDLLEGTEYKASLSLLAAIELKLHCSIVLFILNIDVKKQIKYLKFSITNELFYYFYLQKMETESL